MSPVGGRRWLLLGACLCWFGLIVLAGCGEPAELATEPSSPETPSVPDESASTIPAVDAGATLPDDTASGEADDQADASVDDASTVLRRRTSEYVYDPINRTDPFEPCFELEDETLDTGGPTLFEIRFYQLRAISWGTQEPVAMVEDPEGSAYGIRIGDVIGAERGEVIAITSEKIQIRVVSLGVMGREIVNTIDILLHPEANLRFNQGGSR